MKVSSREKAVNTAKTLFIEKGKDGVRMQEIADKAGINKGLLHYYFKNKEKLFLEIFSEEFGHIYADINEILKSDLGMDDKFSKIIDRYFEMLNENPNLPSFILFEVNKHPEIVKELSSEVRLEETVELLNAEFRANKITSTKEFAFQVVLNIISLCIFPFMMKPMGAEMARRNGFEWSDLMERRKVFLKEIIINSFKP